MTYPAPARQYGRVFYPGYVPHLPSQAKIRPYNVGRNKAKRLRKLYALMRKTK